MIGDVKMQTIKRRTGRSLTGDRPLFLALNYHYKFYLRYSIGYTLHNVLYCRKLFVYDSEENIFI